MHKLFKINLQNVSPNAARKQCFSFENCVRLDDLAGWWCVLVGIDVVYWWQPVFLFTSSFSISATYLLVLMLCACWYWCCVLVAAHVFVQHPLLVFMLRTCWYWCCVLVGIDAVYLWQPMFFLTSPFCIYATYLLVLMLCTCWYWWCVLVAAHSTARHRGWLNITGCATMLWLLL